MYLTTNDAAPTQVPTLACPEKSLASPGQSSDPGKKFNPRSLYESASGDDIRETGYRAFPFDTGTRGSVQALFQDRWASGFLQSSCT